jgi:hypothetical protein
MLFRISDRARQSWNAAYPKPVYDKFLLDSPDSFIVLPPSRLPLLPLNNPQHLSLCHTINFWFRSMFLYNGPRVV